MENKTTEPNDFTSPLLPTSYGAHDVGVDFLEKRHNEASSVPTTLILTTLVAVFGSYVFGSAVSYCFVVIFSIKKIVFLKMVEFMMAILKLWYEGWFFSAW